MKRLSRRGVDLCPNPACSGRDSHAGGSSQIENTYKETTHIRRSRACSDCGYSWSTAEIPLPEYRRLTKIVERMKRILK